MLLTKITIVLVFLSAGLGSQRALLIFGQQTAAAKKTQRTPTVLEPASSKQLQVPQFGSFGNAQCDNDGNLFYHLDTEGYSGNLVMKLSPRTETPILFHLPPEFASKMSFMDFSVTPESSIAFLAQSTDGNFVFKFDQDGSLKGRVQLDTPERLFPDLFAIAENGVVFISGHFDSGASEHSRGKGYAALFESSGSLRKELQGSGEGVDLKMVSKVLQAGAVAVREDGSFYFLRSQDVLVVSQSGSLRRIPFVKPDPEQIPADIKLSGGLMSIALRKKVAGYLTWSALVLNDSTGEVFGYYTVSKESGNNNVCFLGRDGFIFQTVQDQKIKLLTVPLR